MVSLEEQPLGNSFEKVFIGNAGSAGGAGLDITEVFSTYLYTGTGQSLAINNGIDLDGEGGLVWGKNRDDAFDHNLTDTERGVSKHIRSNTTDAEQFLSGYNVTAFNSNGFSLGLGNDLNGSYDYASWTFRKAPKFFDVVTWIGNSTEGRTVSHNLGSIPGMILVKGTSNSGDWSVYHRSLSNPTGNRLQLNSTSAEIQGRWNNTAPTSTEFTLNDSLDVNGNGRTFVAYLFAHNNSDGEFGPDSDQDIIKCGSFTGGGDVAVDVGFEPQWVLTKATGLSQKWTIHDTMRGYTADATGQATLHPNLSDAEDAGVDAALTSTGFRTINSSSGQTYIYMAVRRGQLALPEAGTEVFKPVLATSTDAYSVGFETDFALFNKLAGLSFNTIATTRLQGGGKRLSTATTAAEVTSNVVEFDLQDSFKQNILGSSPLVRYHWKRAPSYFDCVIYDGSSSAGTLDVKHNLAAKPELIIAKKRSKVSAWGVITSITASNFLVTGTMNTAPLSTQTYSSTSYLPSEPTDTSLIVNTDTGIGSSGNFIAYLFASLAGVSKVGSYTGNGSSQTIDAGFTTGARFILIKRTGDSGVVTGNDWYVWDTARGVVTGNSQHLSLNTTAAQVSDDSIDPDSSGFIVNQVGDPSINASSAVYIYYAVA